MKFKLYKDQCEINDYLDFPMFGINSNYLSPDNRSHYDDYLPEEMRQRFEDIEEALESFKPLIEQFYFRTFSLANICRRIESIFNYQSIETYIEAIRSYDNQTFKYKVVQVLLEEVEEANLEEPGLIQKVIDDNHYITYINKLSDDGKEKWFLMQLLDNPMGMVETWLGLLTSLNPLYLNYKGLYQGQALDYGEDMIDKLNASQGAYLKDLSDGLVDKELILSGVILVSWVNSLSILLSTNSHPQYMVLGYQIEAFFENMRLVKEKANLDKITAFKNLGDKTRYRVLKCVAEGIISTKDIAEIIGVSSATISYHINNLVTSRLLHHNKVDGKLKLAVNRSWIDQLILSLKEDFLQ